MSFLFEIQTKKRKIEREEKRKVAMDVRAPQRLQAHSLKNSSPLRAKRYSLAQAVQQGQRFDGVRASAPLAPASAHYIQRISEIQRSKEGIKSKFFQFRNFSFSIPRSSLRGVWIWAEQIPFSFPKLAPNKLVYGSIMSGVAFGMVSLGLIEKTFEMNATAAVGEESSKVETVALTTENYDPEKDVFLQYFSDAADAEYQENVRELVKGYPIEEMLPYIFEKDRITAAFLIGIAKKESNWGKRVPVLDGQDCFNYWGYRGQRRLMGTGGHTCFNSRKDAVDTVAKRLNTLIDSERLNTPEKLIVWKCGMSCDGHSKESVQKWISDVDAYYSEMMALESQNIELEEPLEGS